MKKVTFKTGNLLSCILYLFILTSCDGQIFSSFSKESSFVESSQIRQRLNSESEGKIPESTHIKQGTNSSGGVCLPIEPTQLKLTDIVYFCFTDSDGWTPPGIYTLEIDDSYEYLASFQSSSEYVDWQIPFPESVYKQLLDIINQYNLYTWNGFDEDVKATDMPGFSLEIKSFDGIEINAHGYGMFPEDFHQIREELINVFNTFYKDHLRKQENPSVLANMPDFQTLSLRYLSLRETFISSSGEISEDYLEHLLYNHEDIIFTLIDKQGGEYSRKRRTITSKQSETIRAILESQKIYTWTGQYQNATGRCFDFDAGYVDGSRIHLKIYIDSDPSKEQIEGLAVLLNYFEELYVGWE